MLSPSHSGLSEDTSISGGGVVDQTCCCRVPSGLELGHCGISALLEFHVWRGGTRRFLVTPLTSPVRRKALRFRFCTTFRHRAAVALSNRLSILSCCIFCFLSLYLPLFLFHVCLLFFARWSVTRSLSTVAARAHSLETPINLSVKKLILSFAYKHFLRSVIDFWVSCVKGCFWRL